MASRSSSPDSYDHDDSRRGIPVWLKAFWLMALALLLFLAGMSAGFLIERGRLDDSVVLSGDWEELGTVIDHLERDSYYRPEAAEEAAVWRQELERRAIDGLLHGSGDGHAAFLPPAEAAASSAALTGEYEGVGISIAENHRGSVEVVSVLLDSPAQRADVRVGDVVSAVEATPVADGDIETAAELLRGSAGTRVTMALARPGGEQYEVTLTRERISTGETTVAYRFYPESELAVISISLFALTTTDELDSVILQAREDGVERVVLDLRGNPGGWVSEAQNVIGRFLESDVGAALLEDTWPAGDGMIPLPINDDDAEVFHGEVLVLVDRHTASASEIVASSLQHYERARVIGEPTFGKGSVQRVYDLKSGESLRLTVAEWFTPGEVPLEQVGVTPDVELRVDAPIDELVPAIIDQFNGEQTTPAAVLAATPAG
jgi:carboxyl-terminal processing protease